MRDAWRWLHKGAALLGNRRFRQGLRRGVAAAIEHRHLATLDLRTVVDIGAHHGQFSLLALELFPRARIIAFEPLPAACARFFELLGAEDRVELVRSAVGAGAGQACLHVAGRDDSSSLLPITAAQTEFAPGTHEVAPQTVPVAPLGDLLPAERIAPPALLKIDVQGFEREVLTGASDLLGRFDVVYVEQSFRELYAGQALAADLIDLLGASGFRLHGVYNMAYDGHGQAVQGDFDFRSRPDA